MKISYNWLQEYISGKLPKPEKVAELLTMHSFEVESVEKIGKDSVLDIAVLPNRAHDCLSHTGIAKELGALLKSKIKNQKSKIKEDKKLKVGDYINIEIKDTERCPLYSARVVLNIKVGPSPKWLKERLETLGQKSINNVVDATNYVMLEMGQPTHVFDFDKIKNMQIQKSKFKNQNDNAKFKNIKKIIIRRAERGENIKMLGGGEYKLTEQDLVIADDGGALALAGVKGGVKAEVAGETKNIVLESAYFESSAVRATSKRIGLRTDASWRFENGVVPTLPEKALDRAAGLIAELAGGRVASGIARARGVKFSPSRIFFTAGNINKLLGVNISEKEIFAILKRLGFAVGRHAMPHRAIGCDDYAPLSAFAGGKTKNGYTATAPEERIDVNCFQDLAEEVGRVYGFENIPSVLPESVLIPAPRNDELTISDKIKTILSGTGFCETYNRSFVGDKYLDIFSFDKKRAIAVANQMSLDHKYLRPSLLFHLIGNIAENVKHQKNIRLFEIGNVFLAAGNKSSTAFPVAGKAVLDKITEKTILAGVVFDAEFYEMKSVADLLLEKIGIDHEVWYNEYAPGPEEEKQIWHEGPPANACQGSMPDDTDIIITRNKWQDSVLGLWRAGRTAEVRVGDRVIGRVGEINPRVLRSLNISKRAVAFEFYLKDLIELAEEKVMYRPISKFPAVERDIAVFVPTSVKVDDVQQVIETAGGELLLDSDLFDIYEGNPRTERAEQSSYDGENLEADQKSLAFHLIFQSQERTLTDNEINGIFKKIIKAIESEGWEVRE